MRPISRVAPKMASRSYDTYQIDAPYSTHYTEIDCEAAECAKYEKGWQTVLDEGNFADLAFYIRHQSGRAFTESKNEAGMTVFAFRKGQPCFATHRRRLERVENYYRRHGDFRQYLGTPLKYERPDQWVDDFSSHQDNLKTQIERG